MKLALMLTGLARKVEEGFDRYWKYIIETYNPDLYLHCWKDEEYEKVIDIYKNYNIRLLDVEEPFSFKKYTIGIEADDDKSRPTLPYDVAGNFRGYPMFYSWQKTSNKIEDNYDVLIRSRYDMGNPTPLKLENLDFTKINVSAKHWGGSPIPDDNLLITNQENFNNIFKDCFDNLIQNSEKTKRIFFQEKNFLHLLERKNLSNLIEERNELSFDLLRENKLWY